MDSTNGAPHDNIREIEDIIDIQKANGNFMVRQVAFSIPAAAGTGAGALVARSDESGLARGSRRRRKRGKRRVSPPPPDAVSWPSDSDITVLRMQGAAGGAGGACVRPAAGAAPGDGPHRADGSSMVNLATLVTLAPPSPPASKHSLAHELLLPLSSWERPAPAFSAPAASARERLARFLRLYFCPCCTCLYEMEKNMRDEPSVYLTTRRSLGTDF